MGAARRKFRLLTESLVHHGLLLLLLALFVQQGAEGVPDGDARRHVNPAQTQEAEPAPDDPSSPLVIGRRSPQEHDDQQDGGEQEAPEGVVDPQLPPVLREGPDKRGEHHSSERPSRTST